jgi:hypothetical protein
MAIPVVLLDLICQVARKQGGGTACSAGYPDLLVSADHLAALLGAEQAAHIAIREDSDRILAWHGVRGALDRVFDAAGVFQALGYKLDVVDIVQARGDEIVIDLNRPLPPDFKRSYDIVLDTGTCEHCFHIGQAAINLASIVGPNGIIIQALPLNVYNHGFYNANPTWFFDFYPANGFEIEYFKAVSDIVSNPKFFDVPIHDRFKDVPANSVMIVIAQRKRMMELKVPVQFKYAANPTLEG